MYVHDIPGPASSDLGGTDKKDKPSDSKARAPKVAERSRKVAVSKTSSRLLLDEWLELLDLPVPTQTLTDNDTSASATTQTESQRTENLNTIDSDLKGVLLGRLVAAWISVSGVCIAGKNADVSSGSATQIPNATTDLKLD